MQFIARELSNKTESNSLNPQFWDDMLRASIGRDLRSRYQDTFDQPLPQRLSALLEQLEKRLHSMGS
ncbi:hypothetical protein KBI52_10390 [Microvirga sp. HBU67558]|uniref:NepR family anti-sigma factor n=1 Tax=Microvirga TaxID=186650 RepID=UPI001B386E01|nr:MULTISPECIES: NepR family anti-sigma factor [unclassified Microvirga]MBQ0820612.1 hypothetical protein [Microvirga sp. HBU67558]